MDSDLEDHIDALFHGTRRVPGYMIASWALMMMSIVAGVIVGANDIRSWLPTLVWLIIVCYGNHGIWTTYVTLQRRGYVWVGFWQVARLAPILRPKVKQLPPADEFLALPGAERDVRSIVRVLLSMK